MIQTTWTPGLKTQTLLNILTAVILVLDQREVTGQHFDSFNPSQSARIHFASANYTTASHMSRKVVQSVLSKWQSEGMGAKVRRSVGRNELRNLDPFLMLDEFLVEPPAGFPDHPHRGFETVTYMLEGATRHEDFEGHAGTIGAGDLQWMTAGRGIVHCEMPRGDVPSHGLQLWVNLAKKDKMIAPAYQELLDKDIPKVKKDGVSVKIIAGESMGIKSPVYTRTPTMYLDFRMDPGSHATQATPEGWTVFVYVLTGSVHIGPVESQQRAEPHHTLAWGGELALRREQGRYRVSLYTGWRHATQRTYCSTWPFRDDVTRRHSPGYC